MFSIIEHIEYLLTRHDCVAVPGLGAFIANYNTSRYDEENEVMLRPRRVIGFNAGLSHNDGLLAQSLMTREDLTYDKAMRFIADSVAAFRRQLAAVGEVPVGRLGYFRNGEGRSAEFVRFDNPHAADRYYGLADVNVKTVDALECELAELQAQQEQLAVAAERNLFSRKSVRIAASIAALIGLGAVLTTPILVDRGNHHDLAGMVPAVSAPQSQHLNGATVQQGVVAQPIQAVDAMPGITSAGNEYGKYYMVIATLRNAQELEAFKSKYAALVPYMKLLDYKGLTCVYVARSDDYGLLMSLRDELPQALRDIWIYN